MGNSSDGVFLCNFRVLVLKFETYKDEDVRSSLLLDCCVVRWLA